MVDLHDVVAAPGSGIARTEAISINDQGAILLRGYGAHFVEQRWFLLTPDEGPTPIPVPPAAYAAVPLLLALPASRRLVGRRNLRRDER